MNKARTPSIESETAIAANTQYTLTLRPNTEQFSIYTNHATAVIRVAFESGKVATPTEPYITIPSGREYSPPIPVKILDDTTVYVASDTAGAVVNLHYWS